MTTAVSSGHQPRTWISLWLGLSSLIIAWDFCFVFLRPRSMKGGDLSWIWAPYELYGDIDHLYGFKAWDARDGLPAALSALNVVETCLNFAYVYLAHSTRSPAKMAAAPLVGFTAVTMTLSKTVLYILNDYFCDWCKTGHNSWHDRMFLWIIPNSLWVLIPSLIMYVLGRELYQNLKIVEGAKAAKGADRNAKPTRETPSVPQKEAGRGHYLVNYDQLPDWAKDNPLITRGYRRPGGSGDGSKKAYEHDTFAKCWRSVWAYWHNETVNIHTHMWGTWFALVLLSVHLLQHFRVLPSFVRPLSHHAIFYPSSLTFTTAAGKVLRLSPASYLATADRGGSTLGEASRAIHSTVTVRPPDTLDVLGFGAFFVGAMVCLGFSASYHTVGCHSHYVSRLFNRMDYIGIVVMIVGSFMPALHYGFYCHPHFQLAYSMAIALMGSVAIYVVVAPKYGTPQYRPYRTTVFLVLGLSAIFPVLHVINVYGYETITQTMGLRFLLTSGALYVVGAVLYMLRIPERFAPGRFDLVGSSHQIFHCLILLAAAAHYVSLRRAYAFWHTVEILDETGRAGVCRALQD
ncbi:hypothetical protein ACQY0O_007689 [Thecaphora frezii]